MVTTPTSKQGVPGRDYGLIALFILLAIVVSVVVTWYLTTDGDGSSTASEVAPASLPVSDAATTEAPARGGMAETIDTQQAIRSATPIAVYLVGSEDEANRIRMSLADADSITNAMGLPAFEFRVVVVPPDADPYQMFAEEQNFRNAEGLPSLAIHDMRFPSAETPDMAQTPVVLEKVAPAPVAIEEPPSPVIDNFTPYNIGP